MPGVYVTTQIDYVMLTDLFSWAVNQDLLNQHVAYYQHVMSWDEYCQYVTNLYS